VRDALDHAVSAIYFYGGGDTHGPKLAAALHAIVDDLRPGLAELLLDDPAAAYRLLHPEDP
jgi:hypothetical protein